MQLKLLKSLISIIGVTLKLFLIIISFCKEPLLLLNHELLSIFSYDWAICLFHLFCGWLLYLCVCFSSEFLTLLHLWSLLVINLLVHKNPLVLAWRLFLLQLTNQVWEFLSILISFYLILFICFLCECKE